MKCRQCSKHFQWLIDVNIKHAIARRRSSHIYYTKELVIIGEAEFECSGYYDDGRLWDEVVEVRDIDVYGLLSEHVEAVIFDEITRRMEATDDLSIM